MSCWESSCTGARCRSYYFLLFLSYTAQTAEERIKKGEATAIAFGRPFMANPDFVERVAHGWPLADPPEFSAWFSPDVPKKEKYSAGWAYIDFPTYAQV